MVINNCKIIGFTFSAVTVVNALNSADFYARKTKFLSLQIKFTNNLLF